MHKGKTLEFTCQECQHPLAFGVFDLQHNPHLTCAHCNHHYSFADPTLLRQLSLFEALCQQIRASQEIFSQAYVGIDVAGNAVKLPFKLLLARLNSHLDLKCGDKSLSIMFRLEPGKDALPERNIS